MKWKHPPLIKIYEAIGSVADGRIEATGASGRVYSSSGNKYYDVAYDPDTASIMANDNGSYWQGYVGYPSIAFLMKIGVLPYDKNRAQLLKGIAWKDINQSFKNDFNKALDHILSSKSQAQREALNDFVHTVDEGLRHMDLSLLGQKIKPPEGY